MKFKIIFQLAEWCRGWSLEERKKYHDVWGIWPEQLVHESEKEVTKYYKHFIDGKLQQFQRNNSITIITDNLPVNNTVRFKTDYNYGQARSYHVSLTTIFDKILANVRFLHEKYTCTLN